MKITHYLYNAFTIESGSSKLAIDPGALFLYFFRLTSLIPEREWADITHVLVTHGDIDHYWHADRVVRTAHAPLIVNASMVREVNGKQFVLGPRDKGVAFTTEIADLHTLSVGETIQLDGVSVTGVKTTHGNLRLSIGPFAKTLRPGPEERVGWGAIGFRIALNGKTLINLGDTLLHEQDWATLAGADVLMIPIGGKQIHNTMDEREALRAVEIIQPQLVIPCHYNCPAFFSRKYNPADEGLFKREVERLGFDCAVLHSGDSLTVADAGAGSGVDPSVSSVEGRSRVA